MVPLLVIFPYTKLLFEVKMPFSQLYTLGTLGIVDWQPYVILTKVPIVKVKAGPRVMNLIADAKIYDQILPKQEIKATVSGIYITSFKRIRGPIYEPPKKKKHFWQKK